MKDKTRLYIAICSALFPWVILLGLLHLLARSDLSLELGLGASGFLALLYAALLALSLAPFHSALPSVSLLLRKALSISLIISPLVVLLTSFFPANLLCAVALQGIALYYFLPRWMMREDTVRLEPVFFLIVGMKVAIFAFLFSYTL